MNAQHCLIPLCTITFFPIVFHRSRCAPEKWIIVWWVDRSGLNIMIYRSYRGKDTCSYAISDTNLSMVIGLRLRESLSAPRGERIITEEKRWNRLEPEASCHCRMHLILLYQLIWTSLLNFFARKAQSGCLRDELLRFSLGHASITYIHLYLKDTTAPSLVRILCFDVEDRSNLIHQLLNYRKRRTRCSCLASKGIKMTWLLLQQMSNHCDRMSLHRHQNSFAIWFGLRSQLSNTKARGTWIL